MTPTPQRNPRQGQTMIFMMMVLVILAIVALWNFDLNKILFAKTKARLGGDSAALAGARWQGYTMNTVGQINVMQALMLTEAISRGRTDFPEVEALSDLGARVAFVGPMTGMMAAQQAAKNNNIPVNQTFTDFLYTRAETVRDDYPLNFAEPYAPISGGGSTWEDYADMIEQVASEGVAVEITNAKWFGGYPSGGHTLLNPSFYDAVASRNWCWFLHNEYQLLQDYGTWRDWPALPYISEPEPLNSELLGCGLSHIDRLDQLPAVQSNPRDVLGLLSGFAQTNVPPELLTVEATWYTYDSQQWRDWTPGLVDDTFPWDGNVKDEYNYIGADVAVRIEAESQRISPGQGSDTVLWTSAAKPFGYLEAGDGPVRPNEYGLVLPAFREVRLIPMDASTDQAGGGTRPGWAEFIYEILPLYMERGPYALGTRNNWYLNQLIAWESAAFRATGRNWILINRDDCFRPPTGGGGGGPPPGNGGTRRGH